MKEFLMMLVNPAIMILPPRSVGSGVQGRDYAASPGSPELTWEGVRWLIGSLAAANTRTVRIKTCLVKKDLYGNKTFKNTFVLIMKP